MGEIDPQDRSNYRDASVLMSMKGENEKLLIQEEDKEAQDDKKEMMIVEELPEDRI